MFSAFRVRAIIRHDSKCAVLDIENIEQFGWQNILLNAVFINHEQVVHFKAPFTQSNFL